jgi:hypothetical protein
MIHPFIQRMALRNSVNAAITRGKPIYVEGVDAGRRIALKESMKEWLAVFGVRYCHWEYDSAMYFAELDSLGKVIAEKHADILVPGMISLGISQKCASLYLKYLWLMGDFSKMPLFPPIDGKMMKELGVKKPAGFKQIAASDEMLGILELAEQRAQSEGFRTAVLWEAEWWTDAEEED